MILRLASGASVLRARLEERLAPRTCAAFLKLLPVRQKLIHARWSGEACWIPLGVLRLDVPAENATGSPDPGQILLYSGGISETEILLPYGVSRFACKDGPLEGNHFLTVVEGDLAALGRRVLWEGAQDLVFEAV